MVVLLLLMMMMMMLMLLLLLLLLLLLKGRIPRYCLALVANTAIGRLPSRITNSNTQVHVNQYDKIA